jgi:poly-gamma-glutamate capsule biosynthesis protein CapA/YwtB (metallophosphatase superfamily)
MSRLRLRLVGDVMVGRMVNDLLKRVPPNYPWGDTRTLLHEGDWRVCNLECVISDLGVPWGATPKAFHFRSDAKNIACLKAARINAVSLANNHTLDFEYDGMFEMLRLLDRAGIQHAGVGVNLAQAAKPAVSQVKDAAIGIIAFTDNQPEWAAGPRCPGVFYSPIDVADERAQMLFQTVRETRGKIDLMIVSVHWGPNWGYEPLAGHIRFGHALIDAGADIIFGHSGHVCRGIELYKGHPIIYCAGNFIDDYAVDEEERNDESFIFDVELSERNITGMQLHPTEIADCQARMARGERASEIAFKMARLCKELGTPVRWIATREVLEISGF